MRPGLRVIRAVKSLSSMAVSPRPLVLCGPSGSGKSTLLNKLMKEFPDCFGFSVSHTTRKPREGEVNGREYHFVDRSTMLDGIAREDFIESAEYSGNLYGTSKESVRAVQKSGRICILDIDTQGVKSLKKTDLSPKYVFVKPPSLVELEKRLRLRATETEESLAKRLDMAKTEMAYAEKPGNYDIIITNDNLQDAYQKLREFLMDDIKLIIQK